MAIRQRGTTYTVDVSKNIGDKTHRYREGGFVHEWEAKKVEAKAIELFNEGKTKQEVTAALVGATGRLIVTSKDASDVKTLGDVFEKVRVRDWADMKAKDALWKNAVMVMRHFGANTPIAQINAEDVDDYIIAEKKLEKANGTINRKLAALSKAFAHAARHGWINSKPLFKFLREDSHRIRYFSDEERDYIIPFYVQNGFPEWADFFMVLIDTGARPSEVENMDADRDIDLDRSTWHIWETKTGHPRTLLLTERVKDAIRRMTLQNGRFPFKLCASSKWSRMWNKVRGSLGLEDDPDFVMYVCRHDCATRLLRATKNLVLVKNWLGHSAMATTLRYAHLVPQDFEDGLAALEGEAPKKGLKLVVT